MVTHTSGNFSLVITRQLTRSPKEESFLIIRVFHLPLLSQRFITWTIESDGQFTLPVALSFQTSRPRHTNVLGPQALWLLWPSYHALGLLLCSENEKQGRLLKSFYTC